MRRFFPWLMLCVVLTATSLAYQPGLFGGFVFDDMPNITRNKSLAIDNLDVRTLNKAAFSTSSGVLGRPISMLSFAVNYYHTGLHPFYFKITNLAIHLANGIGIFILSITLLNIYRRRHQPSISVEYLRWVSLAVASAWLLHPFNLTSVLYVVQRMTSLSAFFSIWGLVIYLWGRNLQCEGKNGFLPILLSVLLFTPLAILSKENGALLPLLMLISEFTLLNFYAEKRSVRRFLAGLFILAVAIPTVVVLIYFAADLNRFSAGYASRDFTVVERVMTEARVMWFYIRSIALPSIAQMGLYHDDIITSRGLLQPVSTLFSLAGIVAILLLSILARKKAPLLAFGLLFFLAGHLLESTIIALEMVHEHRNYLPMYGLLLIIFFYILFPLRYATNLRVRQIAAVLLIGMFAFSTYVRSSNWANPFVLAESEVRNHPKSPRANGAIAHSYASLSTDNKNALENNYLFARFYFERSADLSDNYNNGLFSLIVLSATRGKAIESIWVTKLTQRLSQGTYAPDNGDHLLRLVKCQEDGMCKLSKNEIEGILQAPLHNITITNPNRAMALSAWALYLVNIVRDYPAAISAMHQTIKMAPQELEYRSTLIKFLVALQRHDEARIEVAALKSMDAMHLYTTEIETLNKLLIPAK